MTRLNTMLLIEASSCLSNIKGALKYALEEIGNVQGLVILGEIKEKKTIEKLSNLKIPVIYDEKLNSRERIKKGLADFRPEKVYDLSGAPTVMIKDRNEFAGPIIDSGAIYEGLDFSFSSEHPAVPLLRDFILHKSNVTTICFLATGKKVGRTSVINSISKYLEKYKPVFITMDCKGPLTPELISTGKKKYKLDSKSIVTLKKEKKDLNSDNWQIALSTSFPVIRCFRLGEAYRTGVAAFSNIWTGTRIAEEMGTKLIIYQGCAICRPPVKLHGEILITGADQDPALFDKIERYSIIKADMIIITKCEDYNRENFEKLRNFINSLVSTHLVIETIFRPKVLIPEGISIKGTKIILLTNLPDNKTIENYKTWLEDKYECNVADIYNDSSCLCKAINERNYGNDFDYVLTEFSESLPVLIEETEKAGKNLLIYEHNLITVDSNDMKKSLDEVTGLAFIRNS